MTTQEYFVPLEKKELDRLMVVENALGEMGLIEKHLKWVPIEESPSADISDRDYGYMPQRFTDASVPTETNYRPSQEPVDSRGLFTRKLDLSYDTPDHIISKRVQEVDSGWFEFLADEDRLSPEQVKALMDAAFLAYKVDTLTEDNLPAYVETIMGGFRALAKQYGVQIPATEEWGRGIWPGEEGGHLLSMNDYGNKANIFDSPLQSYGRNSQLRSGTEIKFENVIQLFTYTSWQELSTYYAHHNDGALFGPVGEELLSRIASDESKHHKVYFGVLQELMKHFPDEVIRTVYEVLSKLVMPGQAGIPNYRSKGIKIHKSAIFGMGEAYKAAQSVVKKLGLLRDEFDESRLTDEAKYALEELRSLYGQPLNEARRKGEFVLNKTVTIAQLSTLRKEYERQIGLAA